MPTASPQPVREGLAYRGKHWRLWVGMDDVVRCVLEGDQDLDGVEEVLEALGELAQKVPHRPVRVLYYGHRALRLSPDARERLVEACRAHVQLRLAVVRASPLALIQARAIARHSGREFSFHQSEPDALRALGAAQPPPPKPLAPPATQERPDLGIVDHVA